jgi:hypothetical protein
LIFPNGPVVAAHGGFMHGYAAIREHFTAGDLISLVSRGSRAFAQISADSGLLIMLGSLIPGGR